MFLPDRLYVQIRRGLKYVMYTIVDFSHDLSGIERDQISQGATLH